MIHRRGAGVDPPTPSVSSTDCVYGGINHKSIANKTERNGGADATRKRRFRAGSRRTGNRWIRGLRRVVRDVDSLVTLIQIASILIIIYCAIILLLFFSTSTIPVGDDDASVHTWRNSFIIGMNRFFLNREIRFVHSLHHEHPNSGRNNQGTHALDAMDPSPIYTIPGSMPHIGDKSDYYAALRKEYDAMDLPKVEQRYKFKTMRMQADLDGNVQQPKNQPAPYDIHNCPEHPPKGYPYQWNLLQLLDHWNPDDPSIPEDMTIHQGICVFDYEKDYDKALNYRVKEVPFIVSNDPAVQDTAKRWMAPGYMERLMADVKHRTEFSETNHFMYWNAGAMVRRKQHIPTNRAGGNAFLGDGHSDGRGIERNLAKWQQPTKMMRMTYKEWLSHANLTEGESVGPHDPHWYYRLIGCGEQSPMGLCDKGSSEYLFDELTFFQPKENLYMVEPKEQKGIHCRFGMTGVIAENHFDMSRNAIALFGGERRYILADPSQCPFMSLLPKGHPSARHSAVDWSDPDLKTYPEFAHAEGNEVVLQAGDVLYLPTHWFHYIISLNLNFQCNSRSGVTTDYSRVMRQCGF
jgi:hypothetical protein